MIEWRAKQDRQHLRGWSVYEYDSPTANRLVVAGVEEADARRIVRACNAHADLLQACKLTAELCEAVGGVTGCWTASARRVLAREYAACARKAIAKAEGKEVGP